MGLLHRYLHADERGSIVAVSNASGQVIQINAYDDYGIPQGKNAAGAVYTGGTTTANFGRFGYTGQAWLPEIGLNYYKARMYSPTMGRFMQTDPIGYGDGVNLYAYVGGDPVNFSDPSGLEGVGICRPSDDSCVLTGSRTGSRKSRPSSSTPPPPMRNVQADNDDIDRFQADEVQGQSACIARGGSFTPGNLNIGAGTCEEAQTETPKPKMSENGKSKAAKFFGCATAFGENLLNNLIDPLSTAEGLVSIGSGLVGGVIDASIGSGPPAGGVVNIGGKSLKLARVGVGRSAIRTAGVALRGFAIGYAAVSTGVAIYQASQDRRCK